MATHLEQALEWWRKAEQRDYEGPVPRRHARLLIAHGYVELTDDPDGYDLNSKGRRVLSACGEERGVS